MNKGEKYAFVAGLSIMNEQDRVLTALVSQTPLDSRHMVVLTDCHLPWKTHDGVEALDIQEDWSKTRKKLIETVSQKPPGLIVAYVSKTDRLDLLGDLWIESDLNNCGAVVLCPRHEFHDFHDVCMSTRGDLTIYLAGPTAADLQEEILVWDQPVVAPKCFEDSKELAMLELLCKTSEERYLSSFARTCFDGVIEDDEEDMEPSSDDTQVQPMDDSVDLQKLTPAEQESLALDQLALPGTVEEQKRRALWRRLPQRTRIAIRRLHRQFGHPTPQTLRAILKAGKAPAELIESARLVRCTVCEDAKPRPREHPVGPKLQFEFNACVGMDVAEARDNAGNTYSILSFVDIATGFHLAEVVKVGGGMPTSERCANAMVNRWVSWAGWPKQVTCDRGVHNRGVVQRLLASHGFEVVFGDAHGHRKGRKGPRCDESDAQASSG